MMTRLFLIFLLFPLMAFPQEVMQSPSPSLGSGFTNNLTKDDLGEQHFNGNYFGDGYNANQNDEQYDMLIPEIGSAGGGGNDYNFEEVESIREIDPNQTLDIVLNNPGLSEIIKEAIQKDEDELAKTASEFATACKEINSFNFEEFFSRDFTSDFLASKPHFCTLFKGNDSTSNGEITYHIPAESLEQFTPQNNLEKGISSAITGEPRSIIFLDPVEVEDFSNSQVPMELKRTMIHRLWKQLPLQEQMEISVKCPIGGLVNNRAFWQVNERNFDGDPKLRGQGIKICKAQSFEEIMPFLDESIIAEYILHEKVKEGNITKTLATLCHNFPAPNVVKKVSLPPTTESELVFNLAETLRTTNGNYADQGDSGIGIFNRAPNLTPEEEKALADYSSADYTAINTYQMWGKFGLWLLERSNRDNVIPDLTPQQRRDLNPEQLKSYERSKELGFFVPPNWDNMSEEEKKTLRSQYNMNDLWKTKSGVPISETVAHLKSALEKMEPFNGFTYGAHSLSGHFFKNYEPGDTFNPDFFMSTSKDLRVAKNFLDTQFGPPLQEKKILFVVRSRTGVPIKNQSNISVEEEVLLHPDSRYKVIKVEPYYENGEMVDNVDVVYMDEIL